MAGGWGQGSKEQGIIGEILFLVSPFPRKMMGNGLVADIFIWMFYIIDELR